MKRRLRLLSASLTLLLVVSSAPPARAIDEIERQWLVGSSASADGLHPLARRVLERFVTEHPDDRRVPEAFLMLGKARLNTGDTAGALVAFRLAQTFTPVPGAPMEVKLWEGEALLRLKRFAEASAAYDEVFRNDATSPLAVDALYGYGLAEMEMKRPETAASAFRDIVQTWPEHRLAASATLSLATALADLKRFDQALPLLEGFGRKYPTSKLAPNAQYLLGLTRIQTGDRRTGVNDLKAFVEGNPSHEMTPDARRLITDTLSRYGDREDLEQSYKTLTTQKPATAEALYDAAGIAKRLGSAKDQEAMWRRLVDEFPRTLPGRRAALELSGLAFRRKDWKESATLAHLAAESDEDTVKAEGWLQAGEAELKLKQFGAAARSFESVVAIKNAESAVRYRAYAGLGLAREEQKEWKAALAAYESASRTPDSTLRDWATKRVAAMKSHLGSASPAPKPKGKS
jgi:TolA-binding protein